MDRYLSGRYTHATLGEWREHIRAGRVLLDGATAPTDAVLVLEQRLTWHRPPWEEPAAPLGLEVLYRDGGVLVVDKPAGLPTMAGGGFLQHTLVHQLLRLVPGAAPMHRLGRWTSGVVLCSASPAVGAGIAAQFARSTVYKRYRTLGTGRPARGQFGIDVPIGPVPYTPLGTVHAASSAGRPAASQVTVIERRAEDFLADVTIQTGRPHQIRIHLAAAGHPLVGDPLYGVGGAPQPGCTAVPGDPGYQLHAAELGFEHPETGLRVQVLSPLPAALRRT